MQQDAGLEQNAFALTSGATAVIDASTADVGIDRERRRQYRLLRLAVSALVAILGVDVLHPVSVLGDIDPEYGVPVLFFAALIGVMLGSQVLTGRSPHTPHAPRADRRADE